MKKVVRLFLLMGIAVTAGCVSYVNYPTNAELIDRSISSAVSQLKDLSMGENSTIAVAATPDGKINYPQELIQHRLIEQLLKNGDRVQIFDNDMLKQLTFNRMGYGMFQENMFTCTVIPEVNIMAPQSGNTSGGWLSNTLNKPASESQVLGSNVMCIPDNSLIKQIRSITFPVTDYMLFYRVLDAGVRYGDAPFRGITNYVTRLAFTKLDVELIYTKTGQVVWANTVTGTTQDEIPASMVSILDKPVYRYAQHSLPAYEWQETETISPVKGGTSVSSFKKTPMFYNDLEISYGINESSGYPAAYSGDYTSVNISYLRSLYKFFNLGGHLDIGANQTITESHYTLLGRATYPIGSFYPFINLQVGFEDIVFGNKGTTNPFLGTGIGIEYLIQPWFGIFANTDLGWGFGSATTSYTDIAAGLSFHF